MAIAEFLSCYFGCPPDSFAIFLSILVIGLEGKAHYFEAKYFSKRACIYFVY